MKYAFAVAALAASVSAQSISDIPSCATPCVDASRTKVTTCGADDYKCLCDNITAIQNDATTCVISACGATVAVSEVLPAVQKFCAAVEASTAAPAPTSTAAPAPTSTAEATTSAAETTSTAAAETSSTAAAETSSTAAGGYPTSSAPAVTSSSAASAPAYPTTIVTSASSWSAPSVSATKGHNGTASATPTSIVTAGAAMATAGSMGMILLGALGALAL